MKILHVIAGIQETCGVSQFVVEVAKAQRDCGHTVCVVTTMTCGFATGDLDVRIMPDPTRVDFVPELVHIHCLWCGYCHVMARYCRFRGIPYVISPHGAMNAWALRYHWWKKLPAMVLYQYRDLHRAAGFHVTTDNELPVMRRLRLRQPTAIAPLGVKVVDGSDSSLQGEASGFRDVVFVGRIHPVKNLESLIRAWKLTLGQLGAVGRLLIAGSDDVGHQAQLVSLAREIGLTVSDFSHQLEFGKKQIFGGGEVPLASFQSHLAECDSQVVFLGPVYSAAKDWMYAHSWVSTLPSFSENFGGVVLEAMAQGTPVIASKGTPWSSLAGSGRGDGCGWWVEGTPEAIAEALVAALKLDARERREMGSRARNFVAERYSWRASAVALTELYGKITAKGVGS